VLNVANVKLGDGQMTIHGLLMAACMYFVSRARALPVLTAERPRPALVSLYTLLTLLGQVRACVCCVCVCVCVCVLCVCVCVCVCVVCVCCVYARMCVLLASRLSHCSAHSTQCAIHVALLAYLVTLAPPNARPAGAVAFVALACFALLRR
jgi:hypothetical protein